MLLLYLHPSGRQEGQWVFPSTSFVVGWTNTEALMAEQLMELTGSREFSSCLRRDRPSQRSDDIIVIPAVGQQWLPAARSRTQMLARSSTAWFQLQTEKVAEA